MTPKEVDKELDKYTDVFKREGQTEEEAMTSAYIHLQSIGWYKVKGKWHNKFKEEPRSNRTKVKTKTKKKKYRIKVA